MKFTETGLPPSWFIDIEPAADERGFFARLFCEEEFAQAGLPAKFVQSSLSFNHRRGTLRGMHYAAEPALEGKLVTCVRGAVYDVILDLRSGSPHYGHWRAFELRAENARSLYVPPGFAHGFQTLHDDTTILYQMTESYQPGLARGVRWNDRAFAIDWPLADPILSARDVAYPDFMR
jgi:dTDP-4-dehydrorhamnose 3,5-epimerase